MFKTFGEASKFDRAFRIFIQTGNQESNSFILNYYFNTNCTDDHPYPNPEYFVTNQDVEQFQESLTQIFAAHQVVPIFNLEREYNEDNSSASLCLRASFNLNTAEKVAKALTIPAATALLSHHRGIKNMIEAHVRDQQNNTVKLSL